MSSAKKTKIPDNTYISYNHIVYPITKEIVYIGRKPENDLVIQATGVSRLHAQIRYENGEFVIYDLNSANGTFVDLTRVESAALVPGALIHIGEVAMIFITKAKKVTDSLEMNTGTLNGDDVKP